MKVLVAFLTVAGLGFAGCGGSSDQGCRAALDAFATACTTCADTVCSQDIWFNEAECVSLEAGATTPTWDNTEFYTCLTEKFSQTDPLAVCKLDGTGAATTTVREFEDETGVDGCRDLHDVTAL